MTVDYREAAYQITAALNCLQMSGCAGAQAQTNTIGPIAGKHDAEVGSFKSAGRKTRNDSNSNPRQF
jgi:hypothetical protein